MSCSNDSILLPDDVSFWGLTSPIFAGEFEEPPPQALAQRKRIVSDKRYRVVDEGFIEHLQGTRVLSSAHLTEELQETICLKWPGMRHRAT